MRKYYPYLQEQFMYNLNEEQSKREFLRQLDSFVNQKQYVQITLLDWQENPIKEIQGELSGGSLSKDSNNSVRTVGNLSCTVSAGKYDVESLQMDFALNKKVFIEIGIRNDTDMYKDWPILWFPQGVFLFTDFSLNSSTSSAVNLSMTLKDKMCLLNGDVGGKLPAYVQFDVMDTQLPNGEGFQEQKVLVYNIILELLNHFGGEDLNNIVIQDVPLRIRQIVKWNGQNSLYGKYIINADSDEEDDSSNDSNWIFSLDKMTSDENSQVIEYEQNADVGYVYSDFIFTSELAGNIGDSITSILDKIKDYLGNYEYFYNEFGIFIFREIKNYLNITQAETVEEEMDRNIIKFAGGIFELENSSKNQYLIETTNEKTLYAFNDDTNITSITVTPQYGNIKNDYIVNGLRQGTSSDVKHIVRYRLAIDNKPDIFTDGDGKEYYLSSYENVVYYYDEVEGLNKLGVATIVDKLPRVGNLDTIYAKDEEISQWNGREYIVLYEDKEKTIPAKLAIYYPRDWRTALYLKGLMGEVRGTDKGPYYEDLVAFWPQEYCLKPNDQHFLVEESINEDLETYYALSNGNFYLDFIDADSSGLGEYSIDNIGRREDIVSNDEINCLFLPEIPNIIFLNKDNALENWSENTMTTMTDEELKELYADEFTDYSSHNSQAWQDKYAEADKFPSEEIMLKLQRKECEDNMQPWTQVGQEIFSNLSIGGYTNSAYEQIRYELFCHTHYQRSVSITSIPVYYLSPNSRVQLESKSTNTYGDFMVQSINLTFGPGANMAVVLNETMERL